MLESASLPSVQPNYGLAVDDQPTTLVVFVEQTECHCLRWLKRGFKHCFVALKTNDRWIICDSLKNKIEFSLVTLPSNFSLSDFYRRQGYTVLAKSGSPNGISSTIVPEVMTCVSVVKRIIGIRSFWTLTPWQLFCLLNAMSDEWRLVE